MAEVAYSVNGNRVFVRYKDLVDTPKAMTADELIAAANEVIAEESGAEELPEMAELRSLKTRVAKVVFTTEEESASESGEEGKYALIASLRYMAESNKESESL